MLTAVQHKTYQFIKKFITKYGYAPTTAEIATGIGIKSRGVVHRYVQALAEKAMIKTTPNRRRNIQLMEAANAIPLVGCIAAGQPIEAIPQRETIDVVNIFMGPNRYALKVKGDSMIDDGILDGDVVVCEQRDTADEGEIVVALVDDEEATLKRIYRNPNDTITLMPANAKHLPMVYNNNRVRVQGIFVGLLRFSQR